MDHEEPRHNTRGVPDEDMEADTASGGAPEESDSIELPDTTDDEGRPVDNPSG